MLVVWLRSWLLADNDCCKKQWEHLTLFCTSTSTSAFRSGPPRRAAPTNAVAPTPDLASLACTVNSFISIGGSFWPMPYPAPVTAPVLPAPRLWGGGKCRNPCVRLSQIELRLLLAARVNNDCKSRCWRQSGQIAVSYMFYRCSFLVAGFFCFKDLSLPIQDFRAKSRII